MSRADGHVDLIGTTRRQTWGVVDWLITEVAHLGVDIRMNTYVEAEEIDAETPDIVIIAADGWPDRSKIDGATMVISSWDVLSGEARLTADILLFDEVGDHPALVCADVMARMGCTVSHVSPDRATAHDLGLTNSAVVLRDLAKQGVTFECFQDLISVAPSGNRKEATLRHVLTGETSVHMVVHVVIEHGITPMDALYNDLKSQSRNLGQIDQTAMVEEENPLIATQPSITICLHGSVMQLRGIIFTQPCMMPCRFAKISKATGRAELCMSETTALRLRTSPLQQYHPRRILTYPLQHH